MQSSGQRRWYVSIFSCLCLFTLSLSATVQSIQFDQSATGFSFAPPDPLLLKPLDFIHQAQLSQILAPVSLISHAPAEVDLTSYHYYTKFIYQLIISLKYRVSDSPKAWFIYQYLAALTGFDNNDDDETIGCSQECQPTVNGQAVLDCETVYSAHKELMHYLPFTGQPESSRGGNDHNELASGAVSCFGLFTLKKKKKNGTVASSNNIIPEIGCFQPELNDKPLAPEVGCFQPELGDKPLALSEVANPQVTKMTFCNQKGYALNWIVPIKETQKYRGFGIAAPGRAYVTMGIGSETLDTRSETPYVHSNELDTVPDELNEQFSNSYCITVNSYNFRLLARYRAHDDQGEIHLHFTVLNGQYNDKLKWPVFPLVEFVLCRKGFSKPLIANKKPVGILLVPNKESGFHKLPEGLGSDYSGNRLLVDSNTWKTIVNDGCMSIRVITRLLN